ncbi:MAG: glycosyltransferase family 4 protein [bacterium]|nr:glycosyltransferase family 4 protein [bacterium]
MRIVQLSTMNAYYGGEVHLASLADGMQGLGHELVCIVRPDSAMATVLPEMGIRTQPLPLVDWYDWASVIRLRNFLQEWQCEILHSHVPRDYFLAAVASVNTEIVNVGTRHQLWPLSHAFLKRPFLRRFSQFIGVSEAVRQGLVSIEAVPEQNISVVWHGLDPFSVSEKIRTQKRLQMGVVGDDLLVGCVGRICPTKGQGLLLSAMKELKNRWPRVKVCFVGDSGGTDRYQEHLLKMVKELELDHQVHFVGYQNDAAQFSTAFDVQVVPSVAEPFGLVTLEAMRAGIPVVVSHSGGSPELVRDGVEGFLFQPGDVAGLARKLESLFESPGLREEMGRRGKQRMLNVFTRNRMLKETEAVYLRALGGNIEHQGPIEANKQA